jgi:hypothetical protein
MELRIWWRRRWSIGKLEIGGGGGWGKSGFAIGAKYVVRKGGGEGRGGGNI